MNILLTGEPHVGKSTLLNSIVADVSNKQGFVTNELLENGSRYGFELVSALGDRAVLASIHSNSDIRVSKYGVNVGELDSFLAKLPGIEPSSLLYIDEIGQMELYSSSFLKLVQQYLDAPNPFIGTLTSVYQDAFTEQIKARDDIEVIHLTTSSRDKIRVDLATRIAKLFCG